MPTERDCHNESMKILTCDRWLQIQEWMPSYEEWSERLRLRSPSPISKKEAAWQFLRAESTVAVFPYVQQTIPQNSSLLDMIVSNKTDFSPEQAGMLYSQGVDFLYGMLFHETFSFQSIVLEKNGAELETRDPTALMLTFYIASDQDVDTGRACLNTLLLEDTRPCHVFVIAEDQQTLPPLENCSTVALNRQSFNYTYDDPLEKINFLFFQDMTYAADRARSGFIGKAGSSKSALIRERMEYLRRVDTWKLGRIPPILPVFRMCP
jgi:hypothetical protein